MFRSGFVAIVGRPNVGKSTLVNALVGSKVAITSSRPQTTRSAVRGVLDAPGAQAVLIDTPGYHKPRTLLGKRLNEVVRATWSDVDLALFVVDGAAGVGRGDAKVATDLSVARCPVICVVNKVDVMEPPAIAKALAAAAELGDHEAFFPISARSSDGVDELRDDLLGRLAEGPMFYPEGSARDQPPPIFIAELVREKLLERTRDELPHSLAVVTEELVTREDGSLYIEVTIFVERASQKPIVIGKGGQVLKEAGTEAREEIEVLFGTKAFLDLRVKIEPNWQRREHALRRLGFTGEGV